MDVAKHPHTNHCLPTGECYVMVVAKKGYVDTIWMFGHGEKSNDQMLRDLPRVKIGSDAEYYTVVAERDPLHANVAPDQTQGMEDLHVRMGPAYLLEGSFMTEWRKGRRVPALTANPHETKRDETE